MVNLEFSYTKFITIIVTKTMKEEFKDTPLCGMLILPVSLINSGISFVSSILDEMSSSN